VVALERERREEVRSARRPGYPEITSHFRVSACFAGYSRKVFILVVLRKAHARKARPAPIVSSGCSQKVVAADERLLPSLARQVVQASFVLRSTLLLCLVHPYRATRWTFDWSSQCVGLWWQRVTSLLL